MNWWMLGCGVAVFAGGFLLGALGQVSNENKKLRQDLSTEREAVKLALTISKCQNSMIDSLIERLPDKKDEPA